MREKTGKLFSEIGIDLSQVAFKDGRQSPHPIVDLAWIGPNTNHM